MINVSNLDFSQGQYDLERAQTRRKKKFYTSTYVFVIRGAGFLKLLPDSTILKFYPGRLSGRSCQILKKKLPSNACQRRAFEVPTGATGNLSIRHHSVTSAITCYGRGGQLL